MNWPTLRNKHIRIAGVAPAAFFVVLVASTCQGCRPSATPTGHNAEKVKQVSPSVRFEDATNRLGQHEYNNGIEAGRNSIVESLGGGVALIDYDRDQRLDVVLPGGGTFREKAVAGEPTILCRQLDGLRFADAGEPAGLASPGTFTHGAISGDYNNDGFIDVLITGYEGLRLWQNNGDGSFADVTVDSGVDADHAWSSSAAWGDVNDDGHLDLYVAHYVNWSFENDPPCRGASGAERDVCPPRAFDGLDDSLFVSNGDGTFRDPTSESGLVRGGKGLGVVLADIDLDRDLDIYVANDTTDNFLYLNDGRGHFQESGIISGAAVDDRGNANGSMGLAVADFDGDSLPDIWVTNYEEEVFALYRNSGNANFFHASAAAGLRALGTLFVGFGCTAGDFDLDGDPDVAIANGHVVHHPKNAPVLQKPLLLVNDEGRFATALAGSYFAAPHAGRGLAQGDLNNDGLLDLVFVNSREPAALLLNKTIADGRALSVRLIGTTTNRDGIGARVELSTNAGVLARYAVGGGSYLSSNDLAMHFGIPSDSVIDHLAITWSSGAVQRFDAKEFQNALSSKRAFVVVESAN